MLVFPLKKIWYEKIKSGEKTIEYREVKDYWTTRLIKNFCSSCPKTKDELLLLNDILYFQDLDDWLTVIETWFEECKKGLKVRIPCVLTLGYTQSKLNANITKTEIVNGKDTDLAIDKPVYAIHLSNVREEKK